MPNSHDDSVISGIYWFRGGTGGAEGGTIYTTDQYGLRMPDYCGAAREVIDAIQRDAPPDIRCYGISLPGWAWNGNPFESRNPLGPMTEKYRGE